MSVLVTLQGNLINFCSFEHLIKHFLNEFQVCKNGQFESGTVRGIGHTIRTHFQEGVMNLEKGSTIMILCDHRVNISSEYI